MRETSSAVGDRFCTRRPGLLALELIMDGALFIGALRRTRLPFPSRVFETLFCAMAAALKQNTTPAVRMAFVIALIPQVPNQALREAKTSLSTKFGKKTAPCWVSDGGRPVQPFWQSRKANGRASRCNPVRDNCWLAASIRFNPGVAVQLQHLPQVTGSLETNCPPKIAQWGHNEQGFAQCCGSYCDGHFRCCR